MATVRYHPDVRPGGCGMLERIVAGTLKHARRRAHEMHEAVALLEELGVPATMSAAAATSLERIADSQGEPVSR